MKLIFDLIVKARDQMMKNYKISFQNISKYRFVFISNLSSLILELLEDLSL